MEAAPPVTGPAPVMAERGLFGGVSGRGDVDTGDQAWLAAMLDTESLVIKHELSDKQGTASCLSALASVAAP